MLDMLTQAPPAPINAPAPTGPPWWGTAVVAGFFALLGVILTLAGTVLNDRQKTKLAAAEALRTEGREEKRAREREVRERAAAIYGTLQNLVDTEFGLDVPHAVKNVKLVELRLTAQAAFDAFVFVAPAELTLAADRIWIAYRKVRQSAELPEKALAQYYRERYAFANAVRAKYGLDALPE